MRYSVVLYWDDKTQGWTAEVPVLNGVATCGDTIEETLDMARELIALTIVGMREDGEPVPTETVASQLHSVEVTQDDIDRVTQF